MNRLTSRIFSRFGVMKYVKDKLHVVDENHKPYQIARESIYNPTIQTQQYDPQRPNYQTTKLPSGITILTESVTVPSNVEMGIMIDVGSRDEDAETSGSMLLLKNTYLKTAINTNETVNYGIRQMSGGEFQVSINRQSIYYYASCISHDVIDVFGMMADCAFEPKNVVACNVGMAKNEQSFQFDAHTGGNQQFNDNIYAAAYGRQTLGNPLYGSRNNISNLIASVIQQFQMNHLTPNRVIISASGVENHKEFVDLVAEKMDLTQLNSSNYQRTPAKYVGGQIKNYNDSNNVHVGFVFEGANSPNNMMTYLIANQILGNGRKTGLLHRNILSKNVFVNDAQSFYEPYSDSGLFGVKVAGSASHVNDIVNVTAQTLNNLKNVSDEEVELAKLIYKVKLGKIFANNEKRLSLNTKAQYYLNQPFITSAQQLENVNPADVRSAIQSALKSPLTLVAQGGQVSKIPSIERVGQLLN